MACLMADPVCSMHAQCTIHLLHLGDSKKVAYPVSFHSYPSLCPHTYTHAHTHTQTHASQYLDHVQICQLLMGDWLFVLFWYDFFCQWTAQHTRLQRFTYVKSSHCELM